MDQTLSAIEIVRGAYKTMTWADDRRVAVGKISRNVAWELVYQPSHESFGDAGRPWAVFFATYDPDENTFTGRHQANYKTRDNAESYIQLYKRELQHEHVSTYFHGVYVDCFNHDEPDPREIRKAATLYHGPMGDVWEKFDPTYHREFGLVLDNELRRIGA